MTGLVYKSTKSGHRLEWSWAKKMCATVKILETSFLFDFKWYSRLYEAMKMWYAYLLSLTHRDTFLPFWRGKLEFACTIFVLFFFSLLSVSSEWQIFTVLDGYKNGRFERNLPKISWSQLLKSVEEFYEYLIKVAKLNSLLVDFYLNRSRMMIVHDDGLFHVWTIYLPT